MKKLKQFLLLALFVSVGSVFVSSGSASAGTNQCTWTGAGADNNWSTAANWSCSVGSLPSTGYDLIFPITGASFTTINLNNDLPATNSYLGIWGTYSTCSYQQYAITGNGFHLSGDVSLIGGGTCANGGLAISTTGDVVLDSDVSFNDDGDVSTWRLLGFSSGSGKVIVGSNNLTFNTSSFLSKEIIGSGGLTFNNGTSWLNASSPSYDGNITVNGGNLMFNMINGLGSAVGSTTVNNDSRITSDLNNLSNGSHTLAESFIFNTTNTNSSLHDGTLSPEMTQCTGNTYYGRPYSNRVNVIFSGNITLLQNTTIGLGIDASFTGTINGSGYTLNRTWWMGGDMNLAFLSNNSNTPNGVYGASTTNDTLSDIQTYKHLIYRHGTVVLTGTRDGFCVTKGGTLKGTGTTNFITSEGGTINPGMSPGILNSGNVTYDADTTHVAELGGTVLGQYDQLNVTGTVDLGDATLDTQLYGGFSPTLGDMFTIINNDSNDAITGTFNGLAEGGQFTITSGHKFTISYVGGDGNDVVLTSAYVPGPPGTGFSVLKANIILPVSVTLIGFGLFIGQRKLSKNI